MLEAGRLLDRYQVVRHLGDGGMAAVYEVLHTTLSAPHALKVLTATDRRTHDRLLAEGRVQASLRHPNVVTVTDVIDVDGAPGLIMELVRGPSLDRLIALGTLEVDQVDVLARGILAGVAAAHQQGLVHRDLKPENVLCEVTRGGGLVAKVADFGLVKALDVSGGGHMRTSTGQILGTPFYMAPEQVRDSKRVNDRADVWALGVILYEMLCGTRPFEGQDVFEVFQALHRGTWAWPEGLDLSERMRRAVEAALVADPGERVSCQALLDLWVDGTPAPEPAWDPDLLARYAAADAPRSGSALPSEPTLADLDAGFEDAGGFENEDGLPDFDDARAGSLADLDVPRPLASHPSPAPESSSRLPLVALVVAAVVVVLLAAALAVEVGGAFGR